MKNGATTLSLMAAMLCGLDVFADSEIPTSLTPQNTADCVMAHREPQSNRDHACCRKEEKKQALTIERRLSEEEIQRIKLVKEEEKKRVTNLFAELVESGVFRQLNWTNAIQRLQTLRDELKYTDSQLVADTNILKVEMMEKAQEVFVANCKGYVFVRSKLRRYTVADVSEKEISLLKPDGKTPMKMTWVKFYQQYRANLNEFIVKFIEKGRGTSKLKDGKRLSLRSWAEAMMGAALTMQIICGDDPAAAARAEQIAKDVLKMFPDYVRNARTLFPDIAFEVDGDDTAR